jgi:hypothetical protein
MAMNITPRCALPLVVAGATVTVGVLVVVWPALTTLVGGGAVAALLTGGVPRWLGAPKRIRQWAAGSFLLHAVIGLFISHTPGLVSYLGLDADFYHRAGVELAGHWHGVASMPRLPSGKEGFPYMLGALYWVGAPLRDAGILLNAGLVAALVGVVWWTASRVFADTVASATAPLTVLLPGMVIWPAQLLREAAIFLLLGVFAAVSVRLIARASVGSLLLFGATFALLSSFRGPVALTVLIGAATAFLFASRRLSTWLSAVAGVTAALGVVTILGIGLAGLQLATGLDLERLEARRASGSTVRSGFGAEADVSTTEGALSYLPVGLVHVLFGPWPWEIRSARHLPGLIDALTWWLLLPSLVRGLKRSWVDRRWPVLLFVLPALFLAAGLSLSAANFGTILRLRTQILVLLLPVIAAGLRRNHAHSGCALAEVR